MTSRADQLALDAGCSFDPAAAERVRTFFRKFLRHSKGQWAGQPFELLAWQWEQIILPLFGWKRADGTRRFRRAYIEVPKKNGKSTLSAGISLYLLMGDGEPGAEIYSAAADRDQASIVFGEAARMVKASPALSSRLQVINSTKRIVYPANGSWYKALSAEVPTKEGLNIHGLIFDELHAQKTRDLWDTLTYGGAARRQPLLLAITTAGYDRDSICYEQHLYAQGVLAGTVEDPYFFAYIAAANKEDDWKDPAVWKKANPSYGVTISETSFQDDAREAQNSPAKESPFRRYRLNLWTDAAERWISSERWDACDLPLDLEDLAGRGCYAGLDLSSTTDTTSLVLLFPHEDGTYSVLLYCWVPETACRDRERKNRQRFDEWARRGHVEKTPGDVIDYQWIRKKLNELSRLYQIQEVAFDPWNATALSTQLKDEDGFTVIAFRQGYASMSEPAKALEGLILEGKIRHGGNPVLRWMVGNCCVETDSAGNVKPSKKASTEKIDGVVALVMALGRALVHGLPEPPSISFF
jgi:phage terminase large subunit-like protein